MIKQDYLAQLKRQLEFIENSCVLFDKGCRNEAIRIAIAVRVLIHDTRASTSLLKHLRVKNRIKLLTTEDPKIFVENINAANKAIGSSFDRNGLIIHDVLTYMGQGKCMPKFDGFKPWLGEILVDEWWAQEVFVGEQGERRLTREEVVTLAANKDGGAHVDKNLPDDYVTLIKGNYKYVYFDENLGKQIEISPEDNHMAALRQIGYEILNSPELLELVGFEFGCHK